MNPSMHIKHEQLARRLEEIDGALVSAPHMDDVPGFRKADTIVIKPQFKTDGIFKRTGDVTIWLTDDDYRAPVKVETQIPLGKVTVELLSAETEKAKSVTATPP